MPVILAHELDTLTVQNIEEWDRRAGNRAGIFLNVVDKRNLTDERLERFKSLMRERDEPFESRAVDSDELNAKLRQISPRRSHSPSDTASTAVTTIGGIEYTWEELTELKRSSAYKKYQRLKSMGGRPSREINPDPGPPGKLGIDKEYHDSDHWGGENGRMGDEITRWLDFRWHQFTTREDLKKFNKYKEAAHKHQQEKGIGWTVELRLDRQTKLDEWCEYYIYEHRKRGALEKEVDRMKRELEPAKERMRKAKWNGSVGVPETAFSGRWRELIRYDENISQAQREVEMAQKRLKVLRAESLSTAERNMLTEQAEEELESAQKRLETEKSDELDQLNKEAERRQAQGVLRVAQGKVNYANTRLDQLDTLLEWIEGQFAGIATEYASSIWGSQHNRDLLEGWEKYYLYMRDRLQAAQDRFAGKVQEEVEGRRLKHERAVLQAEKSQVERKEEQFKALWAWVEREFPEIAAKYAPSIQDSQSNGDYQDQDQAIIPYSKPSLNEPARKASRSDVGMSTRRKGQSARERSLLSQVQPSKISKSCERRRRPLDQRLSTTCCGVWPPEGHTNDVARVEVQEPPKVALRRSKRISQRICDPASPSPSLVGPLRRSVRISTHTEKLRSLGSNQNVRPAQLSTTARRKSTRHTNVHPNTAYAGTPQGISKTRRWKATSKKGKNV